MSNKLAGNSGKKGTKGKKQVQKNQKLFIWAGAGILLLILLLILAFATQSSKKEKEESAASSEDQSVNLAEVQGPQVTIKVKDYGDIKVQLDENAAPVTVANFEKLVKEGFYDGLTFHRIISGFMIQGGDPLGNGTGGSEETIQGEFSGNGFENPISHKRGVISMARSNDPNSASSQFFIVHQDSPHLDGNYAAFGYVISGMEVVDEICEKTPVQDGNGTVLASDQPVIESIVLDE